LAEGGQHAILSRVAGWSTFSTQEIPMRYLITTGFIAAALVAYYFGLESGSGMLFLAGAIFEIISFKRLRRRAVR
jgi:hypothetical protein